MNVIAAAQAHNRKAVQQNWHQFCDPTLAFSAPCYGQLLDIWRTKAGDHKMPMRSQMTPRDLKDVLRDIVIFERIEQNPSRYRFRLIGTAITDVAGHQTGKTFEEGVSPQHWERWIESLDLVLNSGQPWRFLGRVHVGGRDYLDAENLYLPLANDNHEPAYVMGLCRYTPHVSGSENGWENELASIPGGLL
jgi:hypothetical protein